MDFSHDISWFEELAALAGVPPSWVEQEIGNIAATYGKTISQLSLEETRAVLLTYLEGLSKLQEVACMDVSSQIEDLEKMGAKPTLFC